MKIKTTPITIDGATFHYAQHEDERWWVLRDLGLLGVGLRTNSIDDEDLLDTRPKLAREAAIERWAKRTRAHSGQVLLDWLDQVRAAIDGDEPDMSTALRRLDAGRDVRVTDDAEQLEITSSYTTIDWKSFVYEDDDVRGISLRAMVDAGLYARMDHAVRALERSGLKRSPVRRTFASGQTGTDYVLALADAQFFAISAHTEMGERIARLIIEHHNEFQRLLDGDAEAEQRLHAHRAVTSALDADRDDPILSTLRSAMETRQRQLELEREVYQQREELAGFRTALEEMRRGRWRQEGEVSATWLAGQCRMYSKGGHPHNRAAITLGLARGFAAAGFMRQVAVEAHSGQDRDANPAWVFTHTGAERFRRLVQNEYGLQDFRVPYRGGEYRVFRNR